MFVTELSIVRLAACQTEEKHVQRASRSDAQLFSNCVITVHTAPGAITRRWLLNATGLMDLGWGEEEEEGVGTHRRNNHTKQRSVSINMFAATKVTRIGAPTVRDFTNVLAGVLAYKSDNQDSSSNNENNNRTLHTHKQHCKVLDRVCEATFQIVFYTWQNHIFIT
jgi:hypothetical protein